VINTLRYVLTLTGGRPLYAVLGGMHLVHASTDRVNRTIEELRRLGVKRLGPAHCTGGSAVAALSGAFPGQILACNVGSQFEFEVLPPKPDVVPGNDQECSSPETSQSMVGANVQS
jgi:7,8-dihydropterin-6-yl-methyl-4-(beta-D-ribofuranosyl)aminobenzene 5'-phosphate synthase